jgi:uncharacterized cupin superfamily protein
MAKKLNLSAVPDASGSRYPAPFHEPCMERSWKALGVASGLKLIGVNLVTLKPGIWSSQRHWHMKEDEFVYVVAGELVCVTDDGEELFRTGDCIGFPAGRTDGHHFINRSQADATFLVVSNRAADDTGAYSDIDMMFGVVPDGSRYEGGGIYTRKDGTPYPPRA